MKFLAAFILFSPVALFSQDIITKLDDSSEPINLYLKVNESLNKGNTKLALNIFDEVIEFYEEGGRQSEVPGNYLGMALSLALNGHYAASIRYHKKALRAHNKYKPNEPDDEIWFNLGLAYQLAGKERKAKKILDQ